MKMSNLYFPSLFISFLLLDVLGKMLKKNK